MQICCAFFTSLEKPSEGWLDKSSFPFPWPPAPTRKKKVMPMYWSHCFKDLNGWWDLLHPIPTFIRPISHSSSKAVLCLPFPRLGLVVQQSQIAAGRRPRRGDCWDGGGVFAYLISWALLLHGDTMPSVGIPSWGVLWLMCKDTPLIWWFLDGHFLFRT